MTATAARSARSADADQERRPRPALPLLQAEKGLKGSDGTSIYLVVVENAALTDAQLVLQALGVQDAINLDGGGTAAMWIEGQYTVGPGRLLPNAILLAKP